MLLFDPEDLASFKAVHDLGERMALKAIELDGTCTGEHGIGLGESALSFPRPRQIYSDQETSQLYSHSRQERSDARGTRKRLCLSHEDNQVVARSEQHPEPHENIRLISSNASFSLSAPAHNTSRNLYGTQSVLRFRPSCIRSELCKEQLKIGPRW